MQPPKLYQFAKTSGLISAAKLDEVCAELFEGVLAANGAPPRSAPNIDAIRRTACLKRSSQEQKKTTEIPGNDQTLASQVDATLNGDTDHHEQEKATDNDQRLANELVRKGYVNRWQASQLLDGRTKFTLGNYWVFDSIGKGGYGHVFLGREDRNLRKTKGQSVAAPIDDERLVALKVLPLQKATPALTARFLHEIELQKKLSHLNFVRMIDSGRDGNVHYMVHEFIDGGDLRALLRQEGRLPFDVAAAIVYQMTVGLRYLHENGIIHRDIKPGNILLSSDGTARITDWGFATPSSISGLTATASETVVSEEGSFIERQIDNATGLFGKIAGTVDFIAPDQVRDPQSPKPAWDLYSLGCTFYQLLTGTVPFPNGDPKQKIAAHLRTTPTDPRLFDQSIPFEIVQLCRRLLAKNPSERIGSAWEVAEILRPWLPVHGLSQKIGFGI